MKRKLLSTVVALSMTASMTMPVFAAGNNKTSTIPVTGKVGLWQPDPTNPTDPDLGGGGGEHGEVKPPTNLTDINVTVPTSMTFDVVTNTDDGNPAFASGAYTVTNNSDSQSVTMSGKYIATPGSINLVQDSAVNANRDGRVNLALSLNYGDTEETATNSFIENVIDQANSTAPVTLQAKGGSNTKTLKFVSTEAGMADVKKEASTGGALDNKTLSTKGTLTLTFQAAEM